MLLCSYVKDSNIIVIYCNYDIDYSGMLQKRCVNTSVNTVYHISKIKTLNKQR